MVLAGMAIGGLVYTQIVARLIGRMGGIANLIRVGGVFLSIGFAGVALQGSWGVEMAAFALLGFGFYSIHNSLQTQATELAPGHRGASVALAREGGAAGALELHIVALTVRRQEFPQQNGAPVPQLRVPAAELVAGIDRGDGTGAIGYVVSGC